MGGRRVHSHRSPRRRVRTPQGTAWCSFDQMVTCQPKDRCVDWLYTIAVIVIVIVSEASRRATFNRAERCSAKADELPFIGAQSTSHRTPSTCTTQPPCGLARAGPARRQPMARLERAKTAELPLLPALLSKRML